METVITRDSDVIREYLDVMDAREQSLSPFARLVATIKLARLRRELATTAIETTEDDLAALRRRIDERTSSSLLRRFQARPLGARLSIFLLILLGQQAALLLIFFATWLFVKFAPVDKRWNPALPNEQPAFLYVFLFFFFFATPMMALLAVFGGRFFRSWRATAPATALLVLMSAAVAFVALPSAQLGKVFKSLEQVVNPALRTSSTDQFIRKRALGGMESYRQWIEANSILKDARLRSDYESYLRTGPGRWITSRFDSQTDAAWVTSMDVMEEYLDQHQDAEGFRQWLKYYFDRNRIYSEERIDQEISSITADAQMIGVWQVEPFLRERDERLYRAHFGTVSLRMKRIALIGLGALLLLFLLVCLVRLAFASTRRRRVAPPIVESEETPIAPSSRNDSFPERPYIKTMPFFDAPFEILSRVHKSFLRIAVFAIVFVFLFWIAVYGSALASTPVNPQSQLALMRSYIFFLSDDEAKPAESTGDPRIAAMSEKIDEGEYQYTKKLKAQDQTIASHISDIAQLKTFSMQFQQTTSTLPTQLAELSSRASAAESRVGEVMGQVSGVKQKADALEGQLASKLGQVETRTARASDQIGKIEEQASLLATRTEALEKELDRRARQIEARTEELGERTAALNEREERIARFQRIAFRAILSGITSDVDELDRRSASGSSRAEVQLRGDALAKRISAMTKELSEINTDQAKQFITELDELKKRLDQILARAK
ncbi:MAG: hypothetical protein AB1631_00585 [Acidobacteriota bacterium]